MVGKNEQKRLVFLLKAHRVFLVGSKIAIGTAQHAMDYNWGDPKKNSLLSSRMMAKAEVTRKQRLTHVKPTVSNQLHPAIEHKLRKKKKALGSARQNGLAESSNTNNNELHEHDSTELPQVSDDDADSADDVFPLPSQSPSTDRSMFDEFGLNAAADGLFHPASTIEAFTEHDAKYRQEIKQQTKKPRSGGEYPPSRENHKLPSLSGGKNMRSRFSSRQSSKQHGAASGGSVPTSMASAASLSKLLDTEEAKRSLSANQSDSSLYAPRRQDTVPSTADRNALDFFESDGEEDNNSAHHSAKGSSSNLDSNTAFNGENNAVPPLDISLTKKFEELKRIMKSNRAKHDSARQDGDIAETPNSPKASFENNQNKADSGSSSHRSSETSSTKATPALKRHSARGAKTVMKSSSSTSKRMTTRKPASSSAIVSAPPVRSKKQPKARSGVSLSDLKAEHREALQMLKELGGPIDPDYQLEDADVSTSKSFQLRRTNTRSTTGLSTSFGSTSYLGGGNGSISARRSNANPPATPPTPSTSGISMVAKLRESVSSGRDSARSVGEVGDNKDPDVATKALMPENYDTCDVDNQIHSARSVSEETKPTSPATNPVDSWKLYENDCAASDDEDNNEDGVKPSAGEYSDDDFDSD